MQFIRFALRLFAVSSVIVLSFSCAKETAQDEPLPEGKYRDVTAYAPQAYPASKVTKATLVGINKYADDSLIFAETKSELHGEKDVYWNSGDYMCAMTANMGKTCWAANKLEETSGEGRFSLENLSYAYAFSMGASSQMSSGYSLSGNVLTVTGGFPYTQTLTAGTFGRGNNLVVANASTTNNWMFYNTGALLCVRITPANGSVTIQDKPYGDFETAYALELENLGTDSYFSGDAQVTINGNSTTSAVSGNGSKRLVLSCPGGYEIKQATDFFFIVPPGTFGTNVTGKGIALTVTLSNGQVYCFLNDHQISLGRNDNYLIASISLAGEGEEAVLMDSKGKEVERGTIAAMAGKVTSSDQTVKVLREMFRDDSNFRYVVFQTPCTFDLNGYGFRGNVELDLGSNTGTMMIKNGCVWNGTTGSNKGMIYVTSGAGKVVLDNVKTAALFTGGLDFELNKAVIFGDHIGDSFLALVPEGDSKIDIYAGSAVHFIAQPTGTATVTIHGSYRGESSDANYGPWFMAGNNPTGLNASKYCVTLDGGQILSDGPTGQLGLIEPYRPYPVCTDLSGYTQKFHCCSTKVTGIAIKKDGASVSALNLEQGNSAILTASITPAGATNQNVHWYSSNTAVATVSGGTVTAVGSGSAVISAYSQDGGYHAECNVTVALNHFVFHVGDMTSGENMAMYEGPVEQGWSWRKFPTHEYTTEGLWQNYIEVEKDGTSYFIYDINSFPTSGSDNVYSISVVTASSSAGENDIIPASGFSGTLFLWLHDGDRINSKTICAGTEYTITQDNYGHNTEVSTNLTAGSKYVSVVYDNTSTSAKWKLLQISGEPPAEPQSVTVQPSTLNLTVGNTGNLTASVTPSTAVQTVTWESANSSIATVDANGQVTAVAAGTTTITATTFGGAHSASCTVTVSPGTVHVTGVSLNKTATTLIVGGSETLTATVIPSNATDKSVTWTSSNTAVATVSGGTVTAKAGGTTTITVETNDGHKTATCEVSVISVSITGGGSPTFAGCTESAKTITATKTGSGGSWSCSSSNTSCATVAKGTENGNTCTFTVSPVLPNNGSASTSTITISYGGVNATTTATVNYREQDITTTIKNNLSWSYNSGKVVLNENSSVWTNQPMLYVKDKGVGIIPNTTWWSLSIPSGYSGCYRAMNTARPTNLFDDDDENVFSTNIDQFSTYPTIRSGIKLERHYMRFNIGSSCKMVKFVARNPSYSISGGVYSWGDICGKTNWSNGIVYDVSNSSTTHGGSWPDDDDNHRYKNLNTGSGQDNTFYIKEGGYNFTTIFLSPHSGCSQPHGSFSSESSGWTPLGSFGFTKIAVYKIY